ncbi:unnamed protein product, partial [Phaeothamnion confervicola]
EVAGDGGSSFSGAGDTAGNDGESSRRGRGVSQSNIRTLGASSGGMGCSLLSNPAAAEGRERRYASSDGSGSAAAAGYPSLPDARLTAAFSGSATQAGALGGGAGQQNSPAARVRSAPDESFTSWGLVGSGSGSGGDGGGIRSAGGIGSTCGFGRDRNLGSPVGNGSRRSHDDDSDGGSGGGAYNSHRRNISLGARSGNWSSPEPRDSHNGSGCVRTSLAPGAPAATAAPAAMAPVRTPAGVTAGRGEQSCPPSSPPPAGSVVAAAAAGSDSTAAKIAELRRARDALKAEVM